MSSRNGIVDSDSIRTFLYRASGGFSDKICDQADLKSEDGARQSTGKSADTSRERKGKQKRHKTGGATATHITRLVSLESDFIRTLDDVHVLNSIPQLQKLFASAISSIRDAVAYIRSCDRATECSSCLARQTLSLSGMNDTAYGSIHAAPMSISAVFEAAISRVVVSPEPDADPESRKPEPATQNSPAETASNNDELRLIEDMLNIPTPRHDAAKDAEARISVSLPGPPKLGGTIHIIDNADTNTVSVVLGGVLRDAGIYVAQK